MNKGDLSMSYTMESYSYQMYVNIREASLMATNYFGTKIKNNFYRSNRIDNLTLRISSETQEEEKKLNPQTVLWSESYNNQRSNFWWKSGYYPEIINKVKNKFLQGTNQTVIYEFNQPINISFLKVNLAYFSFLKTLHSKPQVLANRLF